MKGHWQYFLYVVRHKWFVFLACHRTGVSLWRALIHDWSKFLPCEWFAYVHSFYNSDGTKKDWKTRTPEEKNAFNRAWNHHQKVNKHHWQYWLLINDSDTPQIRPLPMPEKYLRELIADWMGAGQAITGKLEYQAWYLSNKEKIILHPSTRVEVEARISALTLMDKARTRDLKQRKRILGY